MFGYEGVFGLFVAHRASPRSFAALTVPPHRSFALVASPSLNNLNNLLGSLRLPAVFCSTLLSLCSLISYLYLAHRAFSHGLLPTTLFLIPVSQSVSYAPFLLFQFMYEGKCVLTILYLSFALGIFYSMTKLKVGKLGVIPRF